MPNFMLSAPPPAAKSRTSWGRRPRLRPTSISLVLALLLPAAALQAQNDSAVQRLMLQANSLVKEGRLEEAIAEYRRVAEAVPESPVAARALIQAARLHLQAAEPEATVELAERILSTYGRLPEAAEAAVLRAEVTSQRAAGSGALDAVASDLEAALVRFSRFDYPDLLARSEGLILIARLKLHLGEPREATAPLVEVLEDESASPLTPRAQLLFAESLLALGNQEAAFQALRAATQSPDEAEVQRARALLTLMHRLALLPQSGTSPWLSARRLSGPAAGFKRPRALAASTLGKVVVVDSANGTYVIDGDETSSYASLKDISRPLFEGETPVFAGPEAVQVGTTRLTFIQGGSKPKDLGRIEAAARDGYGRWALVDRSLDGLARFDTDRAWQGEVTLGGEAVDLARDNRGRVFALSAKPTRVQIFDNELSPVGAFSPAVERPIALDVDPLGNVYLLDEQRKAVSIFDSTGQPIATIGPVLPGGTELRSPEDIAVDGSGRIYIADSRLSAVYVLE